MSAYFTATVSSVGPDAPSLIEGGVVIFFAEPCPEALAEVAVVHDSHQTDQPRDPEPGDTIRLGGSTAEVTRVGEIAGDNLRKLGHVVVYCNVSDDENLLPGAVHARGSLSVPSVGDTIEFVGKDQS